MAQPEAAAVSSSVLGKLGDVSDAPPVLPHQPRPERFFIPSGTEGKEDHELYGNVEAPERPHAEEEEEEEEEEEGGQRGEAAAEPAQPAANLDEAQAEPTEPDAAVASEPAADAAADTPAAADSDTAAPPLLPRDPLPQTFDAPRRTYLPEGLV